VKVEPDTPASAKKPKGSGRGKQYVPPASIVTPPHSVEHAFAVLIEAERKKLGSHG